MKRTPLKRSGPPTRKSAPRRTQPKRDWTDARAKVERERECRYANNLCQFPLEAAHLVGRECDRPKSEGSNLLWVNPDSVVPLCRGHHTMYDRHNLDLLGRLTLDEELQAVRDAGGLELARVRLCPSEYRP